MAVASLLGLYLKFNVLLALALVLWLCTRKVARFTGFALTHARCLRIARTIFAAQLALVAATALLLLLAPEWLATISRQMSPHMAVLTIYANLDADVLQQKPHDDLALSLSGLLNFLLLCGLGMMAIVFTGKLNQLRELVSDATRWKKIGNVTLLFSDDVKSPFSTAALGKKDIVLPYLLLSNPHHLRLAVQHELQHCRNGDLQWVLLLEALQWLCFWNPAMYWWKNEFDTLQELACDEALIRNRNVDALVYGDCLLEVASHAAGHDTLWASSSMVPHFSWLFDPHAQLRERIGSLIELRSVNHATLKMLIFASVLGIGLFNLVPPLFATDSSLMMEPMVPVKRVNPEYPKDALAQGLEASVVIEFDVDNKGMVTEPRIVNSCAHYRNDTSGSCIRHSAFETAALTAFSQWQYSVPRTKAWVSIPVEGIQTVLIFRLE